MKTMNTSVCFVVLLAIGLSSEIEFEIDFDRMVNSLKLPHGKTLLNCPDNCEAAREQCKCVDFSSCMKRSVCECIGKFNFLKNDIKNVCERLEMLPAKIPLSMDWEKPKTPKIFLEYIQNMYQVSNAGNLG